MEVVVPSNNMVERRAAFLALPCRFLLTARVLKEIFQLVVRRSNVLIEGLSIFPTAPLVCTI